MDGDGLRGEPARLGGSQPLAPQLSLLLQVNVSISCSCNVSNVRKWVDEGGMGGWVDGLSYLAIQSPWGCEDWATSVPLWRLRSDLVKVV